MVIGKRRATGRRTGSRAAPAQVEPEAARRRLDGPHRPETHVLTEDRADSTMTASLLSATPRDLRQRFGAMDGPDRSLPSHSRRDDVGHIRPSLEERVL